LETATTDNLPRAPVSTPLPRTDQGWREAAELQRRLEDLRRPQDATQVSTLVMDMAREFFERAALFIVKDDELRGLGGFGPAARDDIILVIREARIPLAEPSVFSQVVATGRAHVGPLPDGRYESLVVDALGRLASREVALLPLVTNRETIALLYADNPVTGAAMRPLHDLEVFLREAGIAIENAFLQHKRARRGEGTELSPEAGPAGHPRRTGFGG
jgi:hypothetical protein